MATLKEIEDYIGFNAMYNDRSATTSKYKLKPYYDTALKEAINGENIEVSYMTLALIEEFADAYENMTSTFRGFFVRKICKQKYETINGFRVQNGEKNKRDWDRMLKGELTVEQFFESMREYEDDITNAEIMREYEGWLYEPRAT